jgi:hypothetical protein
LLASTLGEVKKYLPHHQEVPANVSGCLRTCQTHRSC